VTVTHRRSEVNSRFGPPADRLARSVGFDLSQLVVIAMSRRAERIALPSYHQFASVPHAVCPTPGS
jgi:hypothetical protein